MTNESTGPLRVTVDEISPDQDERLLATLITEAGQQMIVPVEILPEDTRVGDVLLARFEQDPDERERRRQWISDLQRRLFGPR